MKQKIVINKNAQKAKKVLKKIPFLVIILAFIFGLGGGLMGSKLYPNRVTSLDNISDQQKIVTSQSELVSSIAKTVSPSVVSINVEGSQAATSLQLFFGGGGTTQTQSAGTGIILSSDGVIVTNKHVIPDGTTAVSVTTNDGKTYDNVTVLARDPRSNYDIAFLKIPNVNGLKPAKVGDSSTMQVGDMVVAIGYALGEFQNTVTNGIISGLNRPITAGDAGNSTTETLSNLFQTDAAINPGNSGGPLLNLNGEIIGINTAIASNAQNIGFSIPINDVKAQISSILTKGKLEVPYLGVRYVVLTEAIKGQYDLPVADGAWLKATNATLAVINGSPADKAGLKEGDIITKVNQDSINADNVLANVLSKYKVGDTIDITYLRDGEEQKTKATLEIAPMTD